MLFINKVTKVPFYYIKGLKIGFQTWSQKNNYLLSLKTHIIPVVRNVIAIVVETII